MLSDMSWNFPPSGQWRNYKEGSEGKHIPHKPKRLVRRNTVNNDENVRAFLETSSIGALGWGQFQLARHLQAVDKQKEEHSTCHSAHKQVSKE